MVWKNIWSTIKEYTVELAQEWESDNVSSLSAALAYYATFSIVPLFVITIAIGGIVFGEETTRDSLFAELGTWAGPSGVEFVSDALRKTQLADKSANIWATVVSLGVLIVGGTRLFAEFQAALNRVWEVKPTRMAFWDMVRKRLLSFAIIGLMGLLIFLSVLITTVLAAIGQVAAALVPGSIGMWELLNTLTTFGVGTVLFALLFKHLPDVEVSWKDVWLGGALTAATLLLAKWLLGQFLGRTAFGSTYGAASSLIIFLFWVYVSAQITLIGAEFTQIHARRHGREIRPGAKAERRE